MAETAASEKSALVRNLPILAIFVAAVIGFFMFRDYLSFQALADNRQVLLDFRNNNYLATVLVYMTFYVVMVAFSLPGATIATRTGGFLVGTLFGTLFTVSAATMGATIIFLAARHGFGATLGARLEGSKGVVKRIKDGIDENQWAMLFFIRLVPVVPFFMANLVPAFVQVPTYRFVISTFFGIIPGSVVYNSVGAGLGEVFERGETPDLGIIFEPHVLLPILGLAALSLLPVIVKAITGKKGV